MQSLKEKARAFISQHAALAADGRSRYLVDENGQSIELSHPPLPPWLYRVAEGKGDSSDDSNEERDNLGQIRSH